VDAIQIIAENYNLKVLYDAAHAFGVQCHCGSLLKHGDLSVLSFHATKVFTTFEGGAVICPDAKTKQHIDHLKNFGFVNETTVVATGINGKMSEFNAALGLLQLKYIDLALARRQELDHIYRDSLKNISGIRCLEKTEQRVSNYAYFPILIEKDYPLSRDGLYQKLRDHNIHGRRYFYPLISEFPTYRGMQSAQRNNLPVANEVAKKILCLPIYPELLQEDQDAIIELIRKP
jgi:dTDP-4-amino-4,6-dideoxygalactose transaminase